MIQIPEKHEVDDLDKKIDALCEHLEVRFMSVATTVGVKYIVVQNPPPEITE